MSNLLNIPLSNKDNDYQQYLETSNVSLEDDELIAKAINDSIQIQQQEEDEWNIIINESIELSKKEQSLTDIIDDVVITDNINEENDTNQTTVKKRKRPTKNVNKIIMYDYNEIYNTNEIELIYNDKKYDIPIKAELIRDNIQHWNITFETGNELWGTMKWEIKFTDEFPNKPPKVRVLKPLFKPYTGHITIGGAICNPLLVSGQGWDTQTELLLLIIALVNGMVDTDFPAKLNDGDDRVQSYTERNAEAARLRYYKNHGWKY